MKLAAVLIATVLSAAFANGAVTFSAVSVDPSSGSGLTQTFTFVFSASDGPDGIYLMYMDFAVAGVGEPHTCFVLYGNPLWPGFQNGASPPLPFLTLMADNNFGQAGVDVAMGTNQTASNSQCTISGSGGLPTVSGNSITVPVAVTFKPSFNGHKNIFGYATDNLGDNSGSTLLGTWTPSEPALIAVSVTPNMGSGNSQTFSALYSDADGSSDVQAVYLVLSPSTPPSTVNACFIAYVPVTNQLYLFNDADTGLVTGSITPGTASTLSNSQCTLSGAGGTVTLAGNNVTVPFNLTFQGSFIGVPQNIYGLIQRYDGTLGSLTNLGTWTPTAP